LASWCAGGSGGVGPRAGLREAQPQPSPSYLAILLLGLQVYPKLACSHRQQSRFRPMSSACSSPSLPLHKLPARWACWARAGAANHRVVASLPGTHSTKPTRCAHRRDGVHGKHNIRKLHHQQHQQQRGGHAHAVLHKGEGKANGRGRRCGRVSAACWLLRGRGKLHAWVAAPAAPAGHGTLSHGRC